MVAGQGWVPGLASMGQGSQASPLPSPSLSFWSWLGTVGQSSMALGTPSASRSLGSKAEQVVVLGSSGQGSQASPSPSPSKSGCLPLSIGRMGLKIVGQLSMASGIPSPSPSAAETAPVYTVDPLTEAGRMGTHEGSPVGGPQKKAG